MGCRRSDSCFGCKGPSGEDMGGGYYEAGGSFLKLGLVENFLVRGRQGAETRACGYKMISLPLKPAAAVG